MKFIAFGLNHETAPLSVSEAFSLNDDACKEVVEGVRGVIASELVILSTCNRTECYLYGNEADASYLRERIANVVGQPWPYEQSFEYLDEDAVEHILQVTAGARSLVPGDGQILAQMKEAYERAVDLDTVDMVMHRLMHTAFRAAKRVSRETNLASGAASVSSAAIALANSYFEDFGASGIEEKNILFVGAGEMGKLALKAASSYRPRSITVTNRSPERANELARMCGGTARPWSERFDLMNEADLVLVATGAPDPVITAEDVQTRDDRTCLIVDIARPRNVAPEVDKLSGHVVRDLEDLQQWIDSVEESRRDELPSAQQICNELLTEFVSWVFHQEALQPAIGTIRATFEHIRSQEIERHAHRFSDADREELTQITQSILQKLLAVPIVRLKSVDPDNLDFVRGIKLLSTLFERPESRLDRNSGGGSEKDACPFGQQETGDQDSRQLDIEQLRRILSSIDHIKTGE